MASILRSSKFVRYFAGFARNIIFNTSREAEGSLLQQNACICGPLSSGLATASKPDQNLDQSLKRLDQDVRRSGRISRRDIEEVLEEIRQQRTATSSQSLLVIRCCGNLVPDELPEVRTLLVQKIWKTLNNLNVPMDISHYNALLRVYLENEHSFSPTEFLADLELKGIEPNRVTYQRLISRYCQLGDIDGATRILEFMREKMLPVNENVFNALIMGHSHADDMESAAGIISVMQQASLEPSADTYTTLLCGYARKGDIESIKSTLDVCDKKDVYMLDKDFLDIIYALATNGHGDKVDFLMERLHKSAGYNQDAINIILRLSNKGFEDIAFKVLKSMPRGIRNDGEQTDTGSFFIKQLVKCQRPTASILQICKELENDGMHSKPLLVAIESALTHGLVDLTLPLLKEAKDANLPIRQHYFWPMFCSQKSQGHEAVLGVLSKMQNDFNMVPSAETIRDYVIPNLDGKFNPEKTVSLLRGAGVSLSTAAATTVFHLLNKGNLKEAADIASKYKAYFAPSLFRKPLLQAVAKTFDYDSYVQLVRQIIDSLSRLDNLNRNQRGNDAEEETETEAAGDANKAEILGQIVYDAALFFRTNRVEVMTQILTRLVNEGFTITSSKAVRIQEIFGSEMNSEISTLLDKLSSGDLELKVLEPKAQSGSTFSQMDVAQLEKLIVNLEARGENAKGIKRYLLAATIKKRDLAKTEEIVKRLDEEGYLLTSGVYAQLIDLYTHHEQLDKAMNLLETIRTKEPDFQIDNQKAIRLASLLVKNNKMDETFKLLDANKKESSEDQPEQSFNYTSTCWRLFNSLAEAGRDEDLEKLFDNLVKNEYINVSNVLLGPLVKVHLVNNNLKKAMDKFEEFCTKHQLTPYKNELACKLIQAEDAGNLQRLTDLSTNIHGEVNSLYDLVFSFVECGRIRQARKILETPGLRNRPQRINNACERYHQEGLVQPLEGLVEATKDLNHINRSEIFYNLLLSYCKDDQPEKAMGLWTKMQEDDIPATDSFLIKLGDFLHSKGLEVPFIIPQNTVQTTPPSSSGPSKISQSKSGTQPKKATAPALVSRNVVTAIATSESIIAFKNAIKTGDVDTALNIKQNLPDSDKLSVTDQSVLVESLVKNSRLNEATKVVLEMLTNNAHPIPRIFRFYLNKLAASGDFATLKQIGDKLSPDIKKIISYDNRVCHANIVAGNSENYLMQLEADIEKAQTEQEIANVAEKFPRGGAIGILEGNPELADRFEKMAQKYAEKGIVGPMNVLWVHHFINENTETCNKLWDKHLATAPRLMFQRIVQLAREKQDERLIKRLIDSLRSAKVSEGAMGNAYSCLLDVYAVKEMYEDGLVAIDTAVKDVSLDNINRTALVRIKSGIESAGKSFPHKIPEAKVQKNNNSVEEESSTSDDSSSSSSSSEDEKKANAQTK